MKVLILLSFYLFATMLFSEENRVFFNIKSKIEIPSDFRDGVEEALTKRGKALIDEETQEEALKQQAEQQKSECYKDSCKIQVGQMLSANNIVLLKVEKKNNKLYKFKISLINVETGNKISTITMYYKNKLNDYEKLNKFGKQLVFKVFPLSCPDGYVVIDNKCSNKKEVMCKTVNVPRHAKAIKDMVEVSYDGGIWEEPSECEWECKENYDRDGDKCINRKKVLCDVSRELPDGAVWVENNVYIRYSSKNGWSEPAKCKRWVCRDGYRKKRGKCVVSKEARSRSGATTVPDVAVQHRPEPKDNGMVVIPAGKGLSAFKMDKYEVTVAEFKKCVNAGKCSKSNFKTKSDYKYYNYGNSSRDNHPMNGVNWYGAKEYCSFVGKRLPTEAEWKYAAYGTDGREYPWGNEEASCYYAVMDDGDKHGGSDSDGCGKDRTWAVGSKEAGKSPFGLYDMAGNVWEWVEDCYDSTCAFRVLRGGGWNIDSYYLRSSNRYGDRPTGMYIYYGFRCVKSQ